MSGVTVKRAIGYVRVSTQEQAQTGLGLPVQRQAVIDFARREGYELVGTYEDAGVSGTLPLHERPGLRAALADVRERQSDPSPVAALIVPRWDRLGRDTAVSLLAEQEFTRLSCSVVSADGIGVDQTTRELFMVLASAERRSLVARLAAGKQAKAAAGGYAGGRPRFGFRPVKGELVPMRDGRGELEGEAKLVAWIFLRVAKDRWTVRKVADALNERQALGVKWDSARVSRILRCEDYKTGGRPIVDPRIWNRAQHVLAARRRGGGRVATAA